jgi:hypothetical protein
VATQEAELAKLRAQIATLTNKETPKEPGNRRFPANGNYCWSHGHDLSKGHNSKNCTRQREGHKTEATKNNTMGGNTAGKDKK